MAANKKVGPSSTGPFNNPFAGLRERMGTAPSAQPPEERALPAGAPERAVVRYERKGRGGKEVTLIEKLELEAGELATWLREAKGALGCGGTLVDGVLVLQGDQRDRVRSWLEARGVTRISVS